MGERTNIEWCDKTFNPWWGCTKISPACHHCYAETLANRYKLPVWGKDAERRFFGDNHWNEPVKWNRQAELRGVRYAVFCASMADVFEDRADLVPVRARLFNLIGATPFLDWLLLTKRPENVFDMTAWHWADGWPDNVYMGTTVESPEYYSRIDALRQIPARSRFLSMEPLLAHCDLPLEGISAVIVGGESGPHARPMHREWVCSIRDQCERRGVMFMFKQWGEWRPRDYRIDGNVPKNPVIRLGEHGRDTSKLENCTEDMGCEVYMQRVGKKNAGRSLLGQTYDDLPWRPHA